VSETEVASREAGAALDVHEPAFFTQHLPAAGGVIGADVEDFRVDEIPAYEPSGEGEHLYVRVEKRALTTPDLVRLLARAANVSERDIGYAGLKDRRAVTSQWLSLPRTATAPESWSLPEAVRVLEASRHVNKLRTGHLRGNRFRIVIVGLPAEGVVRARAIVDALAERGFPNYFGGQRFGHGGENLRRALDWLKTLGRARLSAFLYKLYPSVVQAEIFNRYLTLRAAEGLERALSGEVMRLSGSGASFVVEDEAAETARLTRGEIVGTGPIIGPKMRPASGEPLALEGRALAELRLTPEELEALGRAAPGARRDLLVRPDGLTMTELGEGRLALEFALPSGSYATQLVRELTRTPLLAEARGE
jgi:tRNA pseudouridine13 synthase